jgi:ComF family protein
MAIKFFKEAVKLGKDVLFPIYCLQCGREGEWLCENCWQKMRLKFSLVLKCPICSKLNHTGEPCESCRRGSFLDKEIGFLKYREESLIGQLLRQFKYYYAEDIDEIWKKVLYHGMGDFFALTEMFDLFEYTVVPVPLHRRRFCERGFNQAEIIANIFSTTAGGLSVSKNLKRIKNTEQQAKLNWLARKENMHEAFVWTGEMNYKKIFLVDDVFTTGATMQECAQVLKTAGAEKVTGITLARAVFSEY